MKLSFLPIVLLFSSLPAFACPDISGTYLCGKTSFRPDTIYTYSRRAEGATWLYKVTARISGDRDDSSSFEFLTDGAEREVADAVTGRRLLVQAFCSESTVQVIGTASFDQPRPIRFSEVLSLDANGDLYDVSDTASGHTMEEVCTRIHE